MLPHDEAGAGPAVVLLHGLSSSRLSYAAVVAHLAARGDVQVVAVPRSMTISGPW